MGLLPPARSAFGEREISVHRVEVGQGKMGRDNGCAPKWFTGGFLFVSELLVAYGRVRGMDYTSGAARWKVRKRLVMPVVSDRRTLLRPRTAALVRLRRRWNRAVEVCFCAAKSCAVSNRNCAAAKRGGEQRNENDQSVTEAAPEGGCRELDSVDVLGRVFE